MADPIPSDVQTYESAITTPDGVMPLFGVHPVSAPAAHWPLLVMFMDVNGLRAELRGFAARYAQAGFHVVLPDLYYRFGRAIAFDARIPIHERSQGEIDRIVELMTALSDDMVMSDAKSLVQGLRAMGRTGLGQAGCVGYCMGGRHVLRAVCELPELFSAGAAMFPTYAVTDALNAPYRRLDRSGGPIYIALGGEDHLMPPDQVAQLREAIAGSSTPIELAVHPGAGHAYAFPERPSVYRSQAAEHDWARALALFDKALTPPPI